MTRRCCGEIRGVSQPVVRFAGAVWRDRGSMLAVEEERRERAGGVVSVEGMEGSEGVKWGRTDCCLRRSGGVSFLGMWEGGVG